jgi:hypothetical protein
MSKLVSVTVLEPLGVSIEALSVANSSKRTLNLGEGVNFVAKVTGSGTIALQWNHLVGGVFQKIKGATGEQYRINPVTVADAGTYTITAKNSGTGEAVTSAPVVLEVKNVPVIVVNPVSISRVSGQPAAFSVVVRSELPVTGYTWYKDGALLSGSSTSSLRLSKVDQSHAGVYKVRIRNADGFVETSARLNVVAKASSLPVISNAGSQGTAFEPTAWWVYWAKATDTKVLNPGKVRNGYLLLERVESKVGGKTVVTPGRAVWMLGSAGVGSSSALKPVDEWSQETVSTQDASASERSEFSALGYRVNGDAFNVSGRLETGGDAAVYGAPEVMAGDYSVADGAFGLDLTWDAEQVLLMGAYDKIKDVEKALNDNLVQELANISGE